eukprot:scaffold1028_cov135-Cylindrotheca_fusiformis.AAC.11
MNNVPASSSSVNEESRLVVEDKPVISNSRGPRQLSKTRGFLSRMKKAFSAFEYETAPSEEGVEDTSRSEDEIISPSGKGRNHCSCCWISIPLVLIAFFLFGGWLAWNSSSSKENALPCRSDPVDALRNDSSLDGLKHGAVASDHKICSEIGMSILRDGGNAVDSAVATILCLGVANPASSGLGGGAFILIHSDKTNFESRVKQGEIPRFHDATDGTVFESNGKITEVIDCRETAPAAASVDMFDTKPVSASSFGGLAVAVPGELRGIELAHARHGKLPWGSVVQPAIDLAENGVPVSQHLAFEIKLAAEEASRKHEEFPSLRSFVTKEDSWLTYFKEGDLLKNPKLAKTLRLIATKGSNGLYTGETAQRLADDVKAVGGILSEKDMTNYLPTLRKPLIGTASGFTIAGIPPPSSGGATLMGAARFLSGYPSPLASAPDTLSVHRMVEALRHAFAIRMSLSDPDFNTNKTATAVKDLTEGDYMEKLRQATLDNDTLPLSLYGGKKWAQLKDVDGKSKVAKDAHEGDRRRSRRLRQLSRRFGYLEDSGTSHLSVVDNDGNAVSVTSSINQLFGSYVFSNSTGIVLGNTMDDFGTPGRSDFYGLKPSKENFIAPGKRPLSSMSPTMVFRKINSEPDDNLGKLALVVGGSGGPKIITSTLQVFINYCLLGMPLFEAVVRPRVHEQLLYHDVAVTTTEKSKLEQGPLIEVPQRTKTALLNRGHSQLLEIDYAGTVQAIGIDMETSLLSAVSDVRKGGTPSGY